MNLSKSELLTLLDAVEYYTEHNKDKHKEFYKDRDVLVYMAAKELQAKYDYPIDLDLDGDGHYVIKYNHKGAITLQEFRKLLIDTISKIKDNVFGRQIDDSFKEQLNEQMHWVVNKIQEILPPEVKIDIFVEIMGLTIHYSIDTKWNEEDGEFISDDYLRGIFINQEAAERTLTEIREYLHLV